MTTRELKSEICYIDKNSKPFFDMYLNRLLTKVKLKKDSKILLVSLGNYKFYKYMKENYKNVIIMDENDNFDGIRNFGIDFKKLEKLNMQFDVAIMNPPYGTSGGDLHVQVLAQVIPHAKKSVCLFPCIWLTDAYAKYMNTNAVKKYKESVCEHISNIEMLENTNKIFGIITDPLMICVCDEHGGFDYESMRGYHMKKGEVELIDKIMSQTTDTFQNHSNKKMGKYNIRIPEVNGSSPFVIPNNHQRVYRTLEEFKKNKSSGGGQKEENKNKAESFVSFSTYNEAYNFMQSCLTKLYKWIKDRSRRNLNVRKKFYPYLCDYSQPWTDERLYRYFNLTPEEIKIIENAV